LNDLTITRDKIAGLDQYEVTGHERGRIDLLKTVGVSSLQALGRGLGPGPAQCVGLRLSAIASAKLANSTVNHSHTVIWPENAAFVPTTVALPTIKSRKKKIVVSAATTSTQNMTGFLTSVSGLSLRSEAPIAGRISDVSNIESRRNRRL